MRIRMILLLAFAVLLGAGCKKEEYPRVAVVPAEFKVLYKGKPAAGAQVVLLPVDDDSPDGIKPRGRVGEDGTFSRLG